VQRERERGDGVFGIRLGGIKGAPRKTPLKLIRTFFDEEKSRELRRKCMTLSLGGN